MKETDLFHRRACVKDSILLPNLLDVLQARGEDSEQAGALKEQHHNRIYQYTAHPTIVFLLSRDGEIRITALEHLGFVDETPEVHLWRDAIRTTQEAESTFSNYEINHILHSK